MGASTVGVAEETEKALIFRIESGQHPVGSRLPPVRELARQFGVNKNTVSRVYRSLALRGYVHTVAGKGVFVAQMPADEGGGDLNQSVHSQISEIAWRCKLLGFSADKTRQIFLRAIKRVYSSDFLRIVFVECNRYDVETLGRQVEEGIGLPLSPCLLRDFQRDAATICRNADLVTTTFYHLAAVREAVEVNGCDTDVVGVHAPPETEGLLRIARAPAGSRVVVVCTEETTLNTIINQVRTYNAAVGLSPFLVGRDDHLVSLLEDADYVIDTNTSHEAVIGAGWESPIITVRFAVDKQSVEFLKGRIGELISSRFAIAAAEDGTDEAWASR